MVHFTFGSWVKELPDLNANDSRYVFQPGECRSIDATLYQTDEIDRIISLFRKLFLSQVSL
jgi:hypothetical protein